MLLEEHKSLPLLLLRTRELVASYFQPLLSRHGLSHLQWRILRLLQEQGPSSLGLIAKEVHVKVSSLTRSIQSLERKKIILRDISSNDKRVHLIGLSPYARKLISSISLSARPIYKQIEESIGKQQLSKFIHDLNVIYDKLCSTEK